MIPGARATGVFSIVLILGDRAVAISAMKEMCRRMGRSM